MQNAWMHNSAGNLSNQMYWNVPRFGKCTKQPNVYLISEFHKTRLNVKKKCETQIKMLCVKRTKNEPKQVECEMYQDALKFAKRVQCKLKYNEMCHCKKCCGICKNIQIYWKCTKHAKEVPKHSKIYK